MPAHHKAAKALSVCVFALALSACQSTGTYLAPPTSGGGGDGVPSATSATSSERIRREPSREIQQVHRWLLDGKYELASKWINSALRHHIDSAELQFLNGLAYHLLAQTDVSKRDLAAEGYRLSLKFDSTQWAPHYLLGVLAMEAREYNRALRHFSDAALHSPDSAALLKDMGAAAYLGRQPDLAAGIYEQLLAKDADNSQYRAHYALSLAALGLHEQATAQTARIADPAHRAYAARRIDNWRRFHRNAEREESTSGGFIPAQYGDDSGDGYSDGYDGGGDSLGGGEGSTEAARSEKQVILDVVFIRSEETVSTRRGVNLLDGLSFMYSDTFEIDVGASADELDGGTGGLRRKRVVKIPGGGEDGGSGITYSLNIINSGSDRSEVLARPSLTVADGQTSRFFSGQNILGVVAGGGGEYAENTQVDRDVGVTLSVTPLFLESGRIQLRINAQRTFLTVGSSGISGFADGLINTSKTEVNTTVVMDFDETLILSGLSEKETGSGRDGVPLLQDIPGVQYLFSQQTTRNFQRSVMVLVTPRQPAYTYQPPADGTADGNNSGDGKSNAAVEEFKSYYQDWFKPYPNWASVFNHLENNRLYREFRTSDVTLERWESRETLQSRLRDALDSFYF